MKKTCKNSSSLFLLILLVLIIKPIYAVEADYDTSDFIKSKDLKIERKSPKLTQQHLKYSMQKKKILFDDKNKKQRPVGRYSNITPDKKIDWSVVDLEGKCDIPGADEMFGYKKKTLDMFNKITIDGINIKDISYESLMDNVSFVFQDTFMLHDTIYENILMGKNYTRDEVENAAKKAQIHDFIMSLPDKYETKIGEGGIKLSGGEKQRISIARAILKNTPIVILDEVTSYSDIENEAKIQSALKTLLKGKTALIIAHRLYTIKNADNIVFMNKGKIMEQGTHDELLKNRADYWHLWSLYNEEKQEN